MTERYWKVLDAEGRACHGGEFQYDLPTWDDEQGWIPGEWTTPIADIEACRRGYHVCRDQDLVHWLHQRIYACEVRGRIIVADNKVVAKSIRLTCPTPWDETSARLFAVECAAEVLENYERQYPNDSRVSDCLEVAYRYALEDATPEELSAAHWAADLAADLAVHSAAACSAAYSAAYSAYSAAYSAYSAYSAANLAARERQTANLLLWLGAE